MLYLKSLEIEYVRCFGKKQRVDFTGSHGKIAQWTVILGDNGSGKTTLLRSIVSLLPPPYSFSKTSQKVPLSIFSKWEKFWNLKHQDGEKSSVLSLMVAECEKPFTNEKYAENLNFRVSYDKNEEIYIQPGQFFDATKLSPVFCFAYGANRKMAETSLAGDNFENTSETLFRDDALLQNSSEYFLRLDYETAKNRKGNAEKERVKELLKKVLPSGVKDIEVFKSGRLQREVRVKTAFGWVNLNELSLGYKTTIAWLIDFATKMIHYHQNSPNPFDEPAILILDEIDLHMHPVWQREIIENLSRTFKKTQFIVTAHSPLIAQAALDANLVLLKKSGNHVKVENNPDVVKNWRIDQILTSDLFGLTASRPRNMEKKITRRRTLLKKATLTVAEKKELELLNQEVNTMPVGENQAEINAMDILRDFADRLKAVQKRKTA